jgi:lactobin A/cerein 7B family class IIb bacteriocin
MKNLNVKGFRELNEKELKAVDGGRWSFSGAILGAIIGGGIGGPAGAVVGAAIGAYVTGIYKPTYL